MFQLLSRLNATVSTFPQPVSPFNRGKVLVRAHPLIPCGGWQGETNTIETWAERLNAEGLTPNSHCTIVYCPEAPNSH